MNVLEPEVRPEVVSEAEWLVAREDLLRREKEFTRERDALAVARRAMPMVRVTKRYTFDGPKGRETLTDLFEDRTQLIVYHFMLGPGEGEGCRGCSFVADHFDGANWHLPQRDVTLAAVSRAPLGEIEAYKKRMGWRFKWVSSNGSDFNFDYHVSFTPEEERKNEVFYNYRRGEYRMEDLPGLSVFYKDDAGSIYHSYSTYARDLDLLIGAYNFLDLVPKGRGEEQYDFAMDWLRRHDQY